MRGRAFRLALLMLIVWPGATWAGMPSPLPANPVRYWQLHQSALDRLQIISTFAAIFLGCAWVTKLLWNSLARDFTRLPRLSFGKALAGVTLWGLLFVIVLTMISGARELMTPGAWNKQGFTYKLAAAPPLSAQPGLEVRRRQHLERLRTALWQFAAVHQGKFPDSGEMTAIPRNLWEFEDAGEMP
jgi:hypothetical protein